MRIRLGLLDKDVKYLERLMSSFNINYSDKVEVFSFTDSEKILESIDSEKISVFLSSTEFDIDVKRLPANCAFAYLVESKG